MSGDWEVFDIGPENEGIVRESQVDTRYVAGMIIARIPGDQHLSLSRNILHACEDLEKTGDTARRYIMRSKIEGVSRRLWVDRHRERFSLEGAIATTSWTVSEEVVLIQGLPLSQITACEPGTPLGSLIDVEGLGEQAIILAEAIENIGKDGLPRGGHTAKIEYKPKPSVRGIPILMF